MKKILTIAALLGLMLSLNSCGYNSMVEKDVAAEKAWADVEAQYQRRADLIPNLVNTVQGYADFEQETLTDVIEARSKATSVNVDADNLTPEAINQFQEAQAGLSSALSRLLVTVERYPDLKANQSFLELQAQLEGTENRITVARNRFNESVGDYNTYIRKFPHVFYASWFDFEKKGFFESAEGTDVVPEVTFD